MRNEEIGNGKLEMKTKLHALFAFSNTFWSGLLLQKIAERK